MIAYSKTQNTGTPPKPGSNHSLPPPPNPLPLSFLLRYPFVTLSIFPGGQGYLLLELESLVSDNLAYAPFHVIENVGGKAIAKMTLLKDLKISTKTKILAQNREFLGAMTRGHCCCKSILCKVIT